MSDGTGGHAAVDGRLSVVAFTGTLRPDCYARALLRAVRELAPPEMAIEIVETADLPWSNPDLGPGDSDRLAALRACVRAADGLLIATAECDDCAPWLEWLSQPVGHQPLFGKPVAILGVAAGKAAVGRAQRYLRQRLDHASARTLPPPDVLVERAPARFDDALRLTHGAARRAVRLTLERFSYWISRERAAVGRALMLPAAPGAEYQERPLGRLQDESRDQSRQNQLRHPSSRTEGLLRP